MGKSGTIEHSSNGQIHKLKDNYNISGALFRNTELKIVTTQGQKYTATGENQLHYQGLLA